MSYSDFINTVFLVSSHIETLFSHIKYAVFMCRWRVVKQKFLRTYKSPGLARPVVPVKAVFFLAYAYKQLTEGVGF